MSKSSETPLTRRCGPGPFGLNQGTDEHRKSFQAFALRPYRADVAAPST